MAASWCRWLDCSAEGDNRQGKPCREGVHRDELTTAEGARNACGRLARGRGWASGARHRLQRDTRSVEGPGSPDAEMCQDCRPCSSLAVRAHACGEARAGLRTCSCDEHRLVAHRSRSAGAAVQVHIIDIVPRGSSHAGLSFGFSLRRRQAEGSVGHKAGGGQLPRLSPASAWSRRVCRETAVGEPHGSRSTVRRGVTSRSPSRSTPRRLVTTAGEYVTAPRCIRTEPRWTMFATLWSVPDHRPQLAQLVTMDRLGLPFEPRPSRCPRWGYDGEMCPAIAGGARVTEDRLERACRRPLRAPSEEELNGHSSYKMPPTGRTSAVGASNALADVARGDRKPAGGPAASGATGAADADGAATARVDATEQLQTRSASASMQDVSSMTALAGLAAAACDHPDAGGSDRSSALAPGRRQQKRDALMATKPAAQQPAAKKQRTASGGAASPASPAKRAARVKLESRPRPPSPPPHQEVSAAS